MGYTRYWERTNKPYDEEFVNQVQQIITKCASYGITICDGFGSGSPEISMDKIWINGSEELNTDHETFAIINTTSEHFKSGNDFCKTARKPYDYAVREILKIAEEQGIVVNVCDDGDNNKIVSDISYMIQEVPYIMFCKFLSKSNKNQAKLLTELQNLDSNNMSDEELLQKYKEICSQDTEFEKFFNEYLQKYKIMGV